MFTVDWPQVKVFIDSREVVLQYVELADKYLLMVFDERFALDSVVYKTTPRNADQIDFEDNYKADSNKRQRRLFFKKERTFTAIGESSVFNVSDAPLKNFAIQVLSNGVVSDWVVTLQGSLDGENFSDILVHSKISTGVNQVLYSGVSVYPNLFVRIKCESLTLGLGTDIKVILLGME